VRPAAVVCVTEITRKVAVHFENTRFQLGVIDAFPLDATVVAIMRERIMRCVPFATSFSYFMF